MKSRAKATQKQILIWVFLTMIGLALACRASDAPAPSNPTPSPTTSDSDEQRLTKAQVKYFEAQTSKGDSSSFSWTGLFTVSGAVIAAMVALLSLYVNNRTAIRNQRDTQFFEALKRFGDQDSATVRASAAATIGLLGTEKVVRWKKDDGKKLPKRESVLLYYETAVHQLITGLMLEENPVTLTAITDAAEKLVQIDSHLVLPSVYRANITLQKDLITALAEFLAATGSKDSWISPARLAHPALVTDYDQEVIAKLIYRHYASFDDLFDIAVQFLMPSIQDYSSGSTQAGEPQSGESPLQDSLAPVTHHATKSKLANAVGRVLKLWQLSTSKPEPVALLSRGSASSERLKALPDARRKLSTSAARLRANVKVFSAVLNADPFKAIHRQLGDNPGSWEGMRDRINLEGAFLVGAQLDHAKLAGAILDAAQLQLASLASADLRGAELRGAQLHGASLLFAHFEEAKIGGSELDAFDHMDSEGKITYSKKTNLSFAHLRGARVSHCSFKNADLSYAELEGTEVTNCDMLGVELYQARFDDKTNFEGSDWWLANYYDDDQKPFKKLLEMLLKKYPNKVPADPDRLHPSVREFLRNNKHSSAQVKEVPET